MDMSTIDKTRFKKFRVEDDDEDVNYWLSQSVTQRMAAQELNRQVIYGYDPTDPIQKVVELFRAPQR